MSDAAEQEFASGLMAHIEAKRGGRRLGPPGAAGNTRPAAASGGIGGGFR
mgnify:CR=1 FL=1